MGWGRGSVDPTDCNPWASGGKSCNTPGRMNGEPFVDKDLRRLTYLRCDPAPSRSRRAKTPGGLTLADVLEAVFNTRFRPVDICV